MAQLSQWATATEPLCHNYRSLRPSPCTLQQEKPLQWGALSPQLKSGSPSLQLEKACTQQQRPSTAKNKLKLFKKSRGAFAIQQVTKPRSTQRPLPQRGWLTLKLYLTMFWGACGLLAVRIRVNSSFSSWGTETPRGSNVEAPAPSEDTLGCKQTSGNLGSVQSPFPRLEVVEGVGVRCCSLTASVKSSWSGGLTVALDCAHSSVPSPTSVPESSSWTKTSHEKQEPYLLRQASRTAGSPFIQHPPRSQALP